MKVFFLALLLSLISFIEIKKLYKDKRIREIYAFSALMIIAAYLSIGQLINLYIPNPTNGLRLIFEPVQNWMLSFLK